MIVSGVIQIPFAASQLLSSSALVDYCYARSLFRRISSPNTFIWNMMLKRSELGRELSDSDHPLLLYREMLGTGGLRPDGHTFMYLLKGLMGCGCDVGAVEQVHAAILTAGFGTSEFVLSVLLRLYVDCGLVEKGRQVFDEMSEPGLIVWTALIRAYVCFESPIRALELFKRMRESDVMPDSVALATVVLACGLAKNLSVAKAVHGFVIRCGVVVDEVLSVGVISMYGECGFLDLAYRIFEGIPLKKRNNVAWNCMIFQCVQRDRLELARKLFTSMPNKDVVTWNTLIQGLCRAGHHKETLALFHEMESKGVKANSVTLLGALSACASLGALKAGTWIHSYAKKNQMNSDGSLDSSLVEMYSKCGNIDKALHLFDNSVRRDLFSWTAIICGLALHGRGTKALDYFSMMVEAGIQPDDITLIGVLNACAHSGLLDQGWWYFESMKTVHRLEPKIEHYGCMVDLLGRMGHVSEAYKLINSMPMPANEVIWGTLLSACRIHNNVELGEISSRMLLLLDPHDPWVRVMLSNMYAKEARWEGVQRLRKELKEKGLRKSPGCSSLEVDGAVHEFLVGHSSHSHHEQIHSILRMLESHFENMIFHHTEDFAISI
uniref:Uncharacterized protein n=1 Tax=Kalanchoe fedtschenkoi TaxID=63787 RepID=A0A7N0U035_KALFE